MESTDVTILVVEDEFLLITQFVEPLEETGFKVSTASNGEEALRVLERDIESIRAVITDVNLGGAITGWDVAQKARELNPLIPIIYATSSAAAEWAAHGVPNSVHINKPFVPVQVVTALSQLLNTTTTSHQ